MAVEIIPTRTDAPFYTQRTALDGKDYIFRFLFNEREWKWYMDFSDQDGVAIVSGMKLVANRDLLRMVVDLRKPPGTMICADLGSAEDGERAPRDPGIEELGDRVKLIYIEADS